MSKIEIIKRNGFKVWIAIMLTLIFVVNVVFIYESRNNKATSAVVACSDPKNVRTAPPGSIKD